MGAQAPLGSGDCPGESPNSRFSPSLWGWSSWNAQIRDEHPLGPVLATPLQGSFKERQCSMLRPKKKNWQPALAEHTMHWN